MLKCDMSDIYERQPPPARRTEAGDGSKRSKVGESKDQAPRQRVYDIVGQTFNPLSAFIARPKRTNFETQFENEEIILLLRRHIITNLGWFLFTGILSAVPLVLTAFPIIDFLPARFKFIVIVMWYLFVFAYFLENFLSWYFNVYIITDERVVDVDFYNLAYKEISDAEVENIEDVTLVMGGAIQTIFNFGRVRIQTAGQVPELEFEQVPCPSKVIDVLKQLQLEEKQEEIEGRVM